MKTSFYFVLWIIIYPILELFNNEFISENSVVIALAVVWGLSWMLNRLMPETLAYERVSQGVPILENIYTGNVSAFIRGLRNETRIITFNSIYLLVTTAVIAYAVFKVGINSWSALIVIGFFTFASISRSINLSKALTTVKSNPTPEQCAETAEEVYKLDYAAYYEDRQSSTYEQILPPRPRHFKAFQIISLVIAGICSLLGTLNIALAALIMLRSSSIAEGALAGMYLLYGSLATYFGIKDFVSTLRSLRAKPALNK